MPPVVDFARQEIIISKLKYILLKKNGNRQQKQVKKEIHIYLRKSLNKGNPK